MKIRRFDPGGDLIVVKAWLHGPRGNRPLSLAFDTAASETHIVPEIIDDLGYSPRQGDAITSVSSAIGRSQLPPPLQLRGALAGRADLHRPGR